MASPEEQFDVNDNEEDQPDEERISITIDVSPILHAKIKVAAAENVLSISEYLGRILEESAVAQNTGITRGHPVTREAIERLRRLREQIAQEHNGQFFEDSAELLRQQREERTQELDAEHHDISYNKEGKPLTREKLEHVLKVREQIIASTSGYTFDDSTELIRQMRDERTRELDKL